MKTIDTLVDDIYGFLEGRSIADQDVLKEFKEDLGPILAARLQHKSEGGATLRMSNIGKPLRQLWYEHNAKELGIVGESIDGKTKLKFLYGDILESLVLCLAVAAGHKVERLQEEIEVDGIVGHIDGVIDGELVDIKSASPFSFKKFEEGSLFDNDPFGYIAQLSGYRSAIGLPARFIAIEKVLGKICTLPLRDDNYDVQGTIHRAREGVSRREPPERCYEPVPVSKTDKSGNRILGVGCSYCRWKEECWKEANQGEGLITYAYSSGPKFFVEIKKQPRVERVGEFQEFAPVEEAAGA